MASNKIWIKSELTRRCMQLKGTSVFNMKPLRSTIEAGVGKISSDSSDEVSVSKRHRMPKNESIETSMIANRMMEGCREVGLGHLTRAKASAYVTQSIDV